MELPGIEGKDQAVERGRKGRLRKRQGHMDGKGLNVINAGGGGRSCRKKGDTRGYNERDGIIRETVQQGKGLM